MKTEPLLSNDTVSNILQKCAKEKSVPRITIISLESGFSSYGDDFCTRSFYNCAYMALQHLSKETLEKVPLLVKEDTRHTKCFVVLE